VPGSTPDGRNGAAEEAATVADSSKGVLPVIPKQCFQHSPTKFVAKVVNAEADQCDKKSVESWNNKRFDECLESSLKALSLGLGEHEQAYAHCTIGQIYIQKGQMMKAVESFLRCLSIPNRPDEPTFGAAVRLHVIYGAAGRSEANELRRLAEASNSKGLRFAGAGQLEKLTKEQVRA
jgi:hypothetical protein